MDERGRSKVIEDAEILKILADSELPAVLTGDVADVSPIGRESMRERLLKLVDRDFVETHKQGRCRIFWITDEGLDRLDELEE